jgi:hypothetical protein
MNSNFIQNEFPFDIFQTNIFTQEEKQSLVSFFYYSTRDNAPTFVLLISKVYQLFTSNNHLLNPETGKHNVIYFFEHVLNFNRERAYYISKMLIIKCDVLFPGRIYRAELWNEI